MKAPLVSWCRAKNFSYSVPSFVGWNSCSNNCLNSSKIPNWHFLDHWCHDNASPSKQSTITFIFSPLMYPTIKIRPMKSRYLQLYCILNTSSISFALLSSSTCPTFLVVLEGNTSINTFLNPLLPSLSWQGHFYPVTLPSNFLNKLFSPPCFGLQ